MTTLSLQANLTAMKNCLIPSLLCFLLLLGCQSDKPNTEQLKNAPQTEVDTAGAEIKQASDKKEAKHNVELWPKLKLPFDPEETARINKRVAELVAKMTLEQKVGQMVQAEMNNITPEQVKKYHIGSVLEGGGSYLYGDKYHPLEGWVKRLDEYYHAAMNSGLPIPLIWGTDSVHGHVKVIGSTVFPHNIGLGATHNPELVRKISEITAIETIILGKDWTFAPEISVVRNDRWGRTYEGYSENPELVAELGYHSILGFQGSIADGTFMDGSRLIATAKHYVGDGGTVDGVDRADNIASEEELIRIHSPGYFRAIEAGVLTIMISHSSWQGIRMHGHKYLMTDVLKDRVGFDGMLIGDWNSHQLVPGCRAESCAAAINAGLDMFMVPEKWKQFIENTVAQVNAGEIPISRIDDAVSRILRTKARAGILDAPPPSKRKWANKLELFGGEEHQKVARQAVRESAVLLKNNNAALPLKPRQKILVVGEAADHIGQQSGGWTISWQGTGTTNKDFPKGASIYDGIVEHVKRGGGRVEYSEDGAYQTKPDAAIVVYGEKPYAEWHGDIRTLEYQPGEHNDAKILQKLQKDGIKTVSVFISGRPLWVNPELNASDAFIAAWLPGAQGAGIADLIFTDKNGEIVHDFSGKLSFSWPKTADQAELNSDVKEGYDPLFAFGFGLNYENGIQQLARLSEDPGLQIDDGLQIKPLFSGRAQAPWKMVIEDNEGSEIYQNSRIQNSILAIGEADKETQGDAIEVNWNGKGEGTVALRAEQAQDFSEFVENDAIIAFDIYRLESATKPVYMTFTCDKSCDFHSHSVDISEKLNASPVNEWNQLSVDLLCYKKASVDMKKLLQGFSFTTSGTAKFRIANITLKPERADTAAYRCR